MKTLLIASILILSSQASFANILHISNVHSVEMNDRSIVYPGDMDTAEQSSLHLRDGVFTVRSAKSILNIELNDGTVVTAEVGEGSDVIAYDPPLGGGNGGNGTGTKN